MMRMLVGGMLVVGALVGCGADATSEEDEGVYESEVLAGKADGAAKPKGPTRTYPGGGKRCKAPASDCTVIIFRNGEEKHSYTGTDGVAHNIGW